MGKLLHSKTFRNNLFKWIFVYVGVLLVVASVVTYSKYMSNIMGQGRASVAKFNVEITKGDICSTLKERFCNLSKYKPYDELEYNFSVDPSEIEVSTNLKLYVTLNNDDFVIDGVDDIDSVTLSGASGYTVNGTTYKLTSSGAVFIEIANVPASDTTVRSFKVKTKLKSMSSSQKDSYYRNSHAYIDDSYVLDISYKAEQID